MKKILITMMETGGGHKMPAEAVRESLEKLFPGRFQPDIIDFARECGAADNDKALKDS